MSREIFMMEEMTKEIVLILIEEYRVDVREALRLLYTSDTYARLLNVKTGLYSQSTAYVYEYLKKELVTGKLA